MSSISTTLPQQLTTWVQQFRLNSGRTINHAGPGPFTDGTSRTFVVDVSDRSDEAYALSKFEMKRAIDGHPGKGLFGSDFDRVTLELTLNGHPCTTMSGGGLSGIHVTVMDPTSEWNTTMSYVRAETRGPGDDAIQFVFDLNGMVKRTDDIVVAKRVIARSWRTEGPLSLSSMTGHFGISFRLGSLLLHRILDVYVSGSTRMETEEVVSDPRGMLEGSRVTDGMPIQGPTHSDEFHGHLMSALQLVGEQDPTVPSLIYSGEMALDEGAGAAG